MKSNRTLAAAALNGQPIMRPADCMSEILQALRENEVDANVASLRMWKLPAVKRENSRAYIVSVVTDNTLTGMSTYIS